MLTETAEPAGDAFFSIPLPLLKTAIIQQALVVCPEIIASQDLPFV